MPRLIQFLPGSISGFEAMLPLSLPQATNEPVRVTAPMKIPSTTSTACSTSVWVAVKCTLNPTSTAAAPTKL